MKEIRTFTTNEIRLLGKSTSTDTQTIQGSAVVYNTLSEKIETYSGSFYESIKESAFGDVETQDILALWSHDTTKILGRTKSKTLRLYNTNKSLDFELDLPNSTIGHETFELIKRGDITSMSFGFRVLLDEFRSASDGMSVIREIVSATLYEISPVAWPAYTQTEVEARTIESLKKFILPVEEKTDNNFNLTENLKRKIFIATL